MNTKIFAKTIEEEASLQIQRMSVSDAYNNCQIRIMPDCHAGAGCTIGTVIGIKDKIVPNTVGVDIGCGMLVVPLGKINIDLVALDNFIKTEIPSGFNINKEPVGRGWYNPSTLTQFKCQEIIDVDITLKSIGSLGGGNHFIEIDSNENGEKFLVIHTGSRNLGVRVCKYYQEKAIKYCKSKRTDFTEIIKNLKLAGRQSEIQSILTEIKATQPPLDEQLAYLEGQDLQDYLNDMKLCQEYAFCNRRTIASQILAFLDLSKILIDFLTDSYPSFTTIHNYIDLSHKILRKGAVSALNGEKLIIPINMRDGSLICIGKGNLDWLYSAPHGAGRLMSRKKAKESLKEEDFIEAMKGIYTTTATKDTIDEAPMVYKSIDEIIECIKDTVDIVDIIKPIYNFKATE